MKTILYILITIFISSILITAFPKNDLKSDQVLRFHCVDNNPTMSVLNKSAGIMKSRLKAYGIQDAEVTINKKSANLEITINGQVDLLETKILLSKKGKVAFYETYNRQEFIDKLGINKELSSLLNVLNNSEKLDESSGILGYCVKESIDKVNQYLKNHYASHPEHSIKFYWSEKPNEKGVYYLYLLHNKAKLTNADISKSEIKTASSGNMPFIELTFNEAGKAIWYEMTKNNINKSIAIVMDERVLQAPIVKSEIKEGKCIITGNFTMKEIQRINALMNNEALPLDFKEKE